MRAFCLDFQLFQPRWYSNDWIETKILSSHLTRLVDFTIVSSKANCAISLWFAFSPLDNIFCTLQTSFSKKTSHLFATFSFVWWSYTSPFAGWLWLLGPLGPLEKMMPARVGGDPSGWKVFTPPLHEGHLTTCVLCCNIIEVTYAVCWYLFFLVLSLSICGFSPSSWAWTPIMVWQGLPWTIWGWNRSVKPSYRSLVQVAWMVVWIFLSIALENWIHWIFCFLVSLLKI